MMIIGNIRISPLSSEEVISLCHQRIAMNASLVIHFVNANSLANSKSDPELIRAYNSETSICLPDGKPLATVLKAKYSKNLSQIRGPDFFRQFVSKQNNADAKHFLIGPTAKIIKEVSQSMHDSGNEVVGFFCPPFVDVTEMPITEILDEIKNSEAQIVWIGLSSPKQDKLAHLIIKELNVIVIPVGAAFLFYTGHLKEAPSMFQKVSLEWLYRLFQEPRRLLKRYTIGNFKFIWVLIKFVYVNREKK